MSGQTPRRSGKGLAVRAGVMLGMIAVAAAAWLLGRGMWQGAAADAADRVPAGNDGGRPETVEMIRPRLAYEAKHGKAKPELSRTAGQHLQWLENSLQQEYRAIGRALAFRNLHDKSIKDFTNAEGFGMERMIIFVPKYLEVPEAPPIRLAVVDDFSESDAGDPVKLPAHDMAKDNPLRLPSLESLTGFHLDGQRSFVNLAGFGFVAHDAKDRKAVLKKGFKSHQFRHMPDVSAAKGGLNTIRFGRPGNGTAVPAGKKDVAPKEKWLVHRLELVSLLKHKEPVAYVSGHLPRMDELRKAETRPLDGFEETSLKTLRGGEDMVADASVNRIYLFGAVRAARQCLDCHQVERGTMLGAFSYELLRVPALAAANGE